MLKAPYAPKIRVLALALLALTVTASAPAGAEETETGREEAKARYHRGLALFEHGDNDQALAEFKRAYELAPRVLVLYNIGLVFVELGRPVEAVEVFERLLAQPSDLEPERLERVREELGRQKEQLGEIVVECSVPGASVELDGLNVGRTPLTSPLRVIGGTHQVGVSAPGYLQGRKQVIVAARAREALHFELVPMVGPAPETGPVDARSSALSPAASRPESNTRAGVRTTPRAPGLPASGTRAAASGATTGGSQRPHSSLTPVGWVALGVGVAALGASGVTALLARSTCGSDGCPPRRSQGENVDRYDTLRTASTVTFYSGGALTLLGAGLELAAGGHSTAAATAPPAVALSVTPYGLSAEGTF